MKTAFIVSYDLNKSGKDYNGMYAELKNTYRWWHHLDSTWLLATDESASQIYERLKSHIDADDNLLVIKVVSAYNGWLPKVAWDWIRENVTSS